MYFLTVFHRSKKMLTFANWLIFLSSRNMSIYSYTQLYCLYTCYTVVLLLKSARIYMIVCMDNYQTYIGLNAYIDNYFCTLLRTAELSRWMRNNLSFGNILSALQSVLFWHINSFVLLKVFNKHNFKMEAEKKAVLFAKYF